MAQKLKLTFGTRTLLSLCAVVALACALASILFPSLPTKEDFAPQDSLDGRYAWKMFGGCTPAEAQKVFEADPSNRIWDFQYMGDRAFAHYFYVLENHVRQRHAPTANFRRRMDVDPLRYGVIAARINNRFTGRVSPEISLLSKRVADLTTFVLENPANDDGRPAGFCSNRKRQNCPQFQTRTSGATRTRGRYRVVDWISLSENRSSQSS